MPLELTPEQEEILNRAAALEEMQKSEGWQYLDAMIVKALAAVERQKLTIPLVVATEDGQVRQVPFESVGYQYAALEERRAGIEAIRAEVTNAILRAKPLREQLSRAEAS